MFHWTKKTPNIWFSNSKNEAKQASCCVNLDISLFVSAFGWVILKNKYRLSSDKLSFIWTRWKHHYYGSLPGPLTELLSLLTVENRVTQEHDRPALHFQGTGFAVRRHSFPPLLIIWSVERVFLLSLMKTTYDEAASQLSGLKEIPVSSQRSGISKHLSTQCDA